MIIEKSIYKIFEKKSNKIQRKLDKGDELVFKINGKNIKVIKEVNGYDETWFVFTYDILNLSKKKTCYFYNMPDVLHSIYTECF